MRVWVAGAVSLFPACACALTNDGDRARQQNQIDVIPGDQLPLRARGPKKGWAEEKGVWLQKLIK